MFKSAGDYLTHFSWSIGTVDRMAIEELRDIADRYFRRTLGVCFYQIALDGAKIESTTNPELGDQPGLKGVWSSGAVKDFPIPCYRPDLRLPVRRVLSVGARWRQGTPPLP